MVVSSIVRPNIQSRMPEDNTQSMAKRDNKMNQIIKMTLASAFAVSGGIIAMGILEQFNTPLTKRACFINYFDCSYDKHYKTSYNNMIPLNIYIIIGASLIITLFVIMNYLHIFNKESSDK